MRKYFFRASQKNSTSLLFEINVKSKLIGLAKGILADDEVNYKEAYQLLYWLEDNLKFAEPNKEGIPAICMLYLALVELFGLFCFFIGTSLDVV